MTPLSIRTAFFSVLNDAENNISSFVCRPGSDMTRHRSCAFSDTVLATICMSMNRTSTELLNYFGNKNIHVPTKSAFTQQRKKLNADLFPALLDSFNKAVPFKKTFKGFHLIAVDGSDINLPTQRKDTVYCVKHARSDNYYYQMHLNAFLDICENRYVSIAIQPRKEMNESQAFCEMVDICMLPDHTIFIADRGYISMNTIAHLIENNKFFLIRAKSPASSGSFLKNMLEENKETDKIIHLAISRSTKHCKHTDADVYKVIGKRNKFRPIDLDDHESVYHMTLRCTCIRLDNGTYEYLVSNLPMEIFSSDDLKDLYWKRWSIETSFRRLKYALALSYLHSVNRDLIIQEVYAKIILYNLTSLLHAYAQKSREILERKKHNKYKYKVAFDNAVPLARMMLMHKTGNKRIKTLLLRNLTAVKDSKASPRRMRSQTVNPLNNRA